MMGPEIETPPPLGTGCRGKEAKEGVLSKAAWQSSGTFAKVWNLSCPNTMVRGVDVFALTEAPEMDLKAPPPEMSAGFDVDRVDKVWPGIGQGGRA